MTAGRPANRSWKIFLYFLAPGLLAGAAVVAWGIIDRPAMHSIPQWKEVWSEPKCPPGEFLSFRTENELVLGESQPFPPNHPRASSWLYSKERFQSSIQLQLDFEFLRDGDLEFQLVDDSDSRIQYAVRIGSLPEKKAGVALYSGNAESPIKVRPEALALNKRYSVQLSRTAKALSFQMNGQTMISMNEVTAMPSSNRFCIRLHNVKIRIHKLELTK